MPVHTLAPLFAALALFVTPTARLPQEHGAMVVFPPYRGPAVPEFPWGPMVVCESGGNWSIDSNNGYYGGFQLSDYFWVAFRPKGAPPFANEATPWEQVYAARGIAREYGFHMWPICSRVING